MADKKVKVMSPFKESRRDDVAEAASLFERHTHDGRETRNVTGNTPNISTGTAAPTTTPKKVGDMFVDTTNDKVYVSTGTSSSTDWNVLN